jgi:hypothetical protein
MDTQDKKFYVDTPDVGFSPKRNKQVIENSIKKYEAMRALKQKQFQEGVGERAEAVASFIQHVNQNGHNNLDRYFGPSMLAKLRGMEIVDRIKSAGGISKPSPFYLDNGLVKNMQGKIVGKEISNVKKAQKRQK